jgi:hypothetical protein
MADSRPKELLDRWRELARQLAAADPTSRDALAAEVQRARHEYFAAVEAIWLAVRETFDDAVTPPVTEDPATPSEAKAGDSEDV